MNEIAVTGAAGFVGRHCVTQARQMGLSVRAFVRDASKAPAAWGGDAGITVVAFDLLADPSVLAEHFEGVASVIHCAATLRGDHARDTLAASRAVSAAVGRAGVQHLVLAGSLSVYDCATLPDGGVLDETCATDTTGRDAYARSKHAQEQVLQEGAAHFGFTLSILRLGAVWGTGQLMNGHLGPARGPVLVTIDGGGDIPLCQAQLAGTCLVRAAQNPDGVGTINIVDDDLPNRRQFVAALRHSGWPKYTPKIPLWILRRVTAVLPNSTHFPGLLRRPILEARHKPLHFGNDLMHKRLGPVTLLPFEAAMQAARKQQLEQATTT